MQKHTFISQLTPLLAQLAPFSAQKITLSSPYFSKTSETVGFFLAEIQKTAESLMAQEESLHAAYCAERLLRQFDALSNAVETLKQRKEEAQFRSSFQFSPHIHRLPEEKRLVEYRKALRALNEKISWLLEQHYNEENAARKESLQQQITETEFRKKRCLAAIEELEQALQFR